MSDFPEGFDFNHGDSGLYDDFDGRIEQPRFGFNPDYMDGEKLLFMFDLVSLDEDVPDQEMQVPVPKGWEVVDGGRRVVREDGKIKNFHAQSGIFKMMEAMGDVNKVVKARKATPMEVAFWDGLTCHWTVTDIDYGGEIGVKQKLLPTKVLGGVKSKDDAPKVDLLEAVTDLAAKTADYATFRTAAYSTFPDLVDDDDVMAKVESEEWFTAQGSF